MLDTERFIEECKSALAEDATHKAVREVVARAVADPSNMLAILGEPAEAAVHKLYHAPDLTILNVVWAPQMTVMPHNHRMWAVIGIYVGAEDNIFWKRNERCIEAAGAQALRAKDAVALGHNIIHSVSNPVDKLTAAVHVYGGDFFSASRSEWDPETLTEMPYDVEKTMRLFAQANARYAASLHGMH